MKIKTSEEKTVSRFWQQVWNEGKTEFIKEFVHSDFVIHSGGKDISGVDSFSAWVKAFQSKISNMSFIVEDMFSSNNRVVTRWSLKGANKGFMGTEENNKLLELMGITISVVKDGKIIEKWVERNAWELYPTIK